MIKILYITVRADYGGGPEHLSLLMKYANTSKFKISVCSPKQEPYYKEFKKLSNKIIEIPKQTFSLNSFFQILKYIKEEKIDIIHSHGRGAGLYSRLLRLFYNTKICHTLHGIHYEENLKIKDKFLFNIEKILNKITNKIICVSEEEKIKGIKLKLFPQKKVSIVFNGIDIEKFQIYLRNKKQINKEYRKTIGLNETDYIIGNISRFHYQKGLPYLLEAFSKINIRNKKLIIIGDGENRKKLENKIMELKIGDQVILLGYRNDIEKIIQIFDLYVTTSLWEGLPISLLEIMASKIPIVATNVTGNNSLIKNQKTGILCISKDIKSIAFKIDESYRGDQNFTDNAYKEVLKKYDVKKMVFSIEKLYEGLVKKM